MGLVFGLIVGGVLTVFGIAQWRRIWSGELLAKSDYSTRAWFPAGEASRRGFVRSTPVGFVVIGALFMCVAAFTLADAVGGAAAGLLDRVSTVAFCVALIAMLVSAGVVLFNRPRWVVPPPYRQQPGAVATWWRGRKADGT